MPILKIFTRASITRQFLPKDILRSSRMFQGKEVETEIARATSSHGWARKVQPMDIKWSNPINVMSGDSIEFSWTGQGKALFHSTGSGSFYTERIQ